jgi:hypothetical protein
MSTDDDEDYKTKLEEYERQVEQYEREQEEYLVREEAYKLEIKEYKTYLDKVIEKASDLFEKQLIYVAAGTIAGSVYIVEKFLAGTQHLLWLLLFVWGLCGGTILVNLLSHYFSMKWNTNTKNEINQNLDYKAKEPHRIKNIDRLNVASLIMYFLGLVAFIFYIGLNIKDMNKTTFSSPETKSMPVQAAPAKPTAPTPAPKKP